MSNLANLDCLGRVNRAIDYIHQNLGGSLSLDEVAKAACFSPYHFHRVFTAIVGETVHSFIKRARLERALYLRKHREGKSLTEIALACGFSSSSDFSRTFKKEFGVSPRDFDLEAHRRTHRAAVGIDELPAGENPDGFSVTLRDLPARHVAYLRITQPFVEGNAERGVRRLMAWADERGFGEGQWLGYMWDEPETVPLEKCRYDVAVEIPKRITADGEVGVLTFAAMRVAEIQIRGSLELETRAIDWLYSTWLPKSGYAPDHHPSFEAWDGRPYAHGTEHFELAVQLPVVDASLPVSIPGG